MNEFDKSEKICDMKTKALFPQYNFVRSEPGTVWDMSGQTRSLTTERDNFFLEVKDRKVSSTAFDTAYLEAKKLRALTNYANMHNADVHYLCFYTDGIAYSFNLRKIGITEVYIVEKNLIAKHDEDAGMKDKIIVELPYHLGKKYRYQV
jgi:hypothetical protein